MRIHELFEDNLINEIRMGPKALVRAASKVEAATTGLEFEMYYPGFSSGVIEDEDTESIDNILEFFSQHDSNSNGFLNRLEQELQDGLAEWTAEQFDQYWDRNSNAEIGDYIYNLTEDDIRSILNLEDDEEEISRGDYLDAVSVIEDDKIEPYYSNARDHALSNFFGTADEGEWLSSVGLDQMSDVARRYEARWPSTNTDSLSHEVLQRIADQLEGYVNTPIRFSTRYHGVPRVAVDADPKDRYWIIEPDSSLNRPREPGDYGIEIISPPISVDEMVEKIASIKDFMKKSGAYTFKGDEKELRGSTGLHMNVGLKGFNPDEIDYMKLILLLGDDYVLNKFERATNTYSIPALKSVSGDVTPEKAELYLEQMRRGFSAKALQALNTLGKFKASNHHFSVHYIIDREDFRIEFRSPGGDWNEKTAEELSDFLRRFVVVLDAASDPNAYQREYKVKLAKMLRSRIPQDPAEEDVIKYFVQYAGGEPPPPGSKETRLPRSALMSFLKTIRQARKFKKTGLKPGETYTWRVMKKSDVGRQNYVAVEVSAKSAEEAIRAARMSGRDWYNIAPEDLVATALPPKRTLVAPENEPDSNYAIVRNSDDAIINYFTRNTPQEAETAYRRWLTSMGIDTQTQLYRLEPVTPRTSYSRTQNNIPPPVLNGRPSNPDGNSYIAFIDDVNTPLYRFMAANGDDARTVLDQWNRQYPGDYVLRPDPRQERGQPQQPETYTIYDTRDRYNIAGIRARTVADAIQQFQQRIATATGIYSDPERYQLRDRNGQVVYPESSINTQSEPAGTGQLQQAAQTDSSTSNNRLWQIVDSADGEVAYEFYLSRENNQQDANEVGLRWVRNNGNPNTSYSVREQPPSTGTIRPASSTRTTDPSIISGWRIVLANGEEVHQGTNTGISQQEAESRASMWLYNNGYGVLEPNQFRVEPIRRGDTPPTQNGSVQWSILVDGEEVHRFWNRNNQGDANAAARAWASEQVRQGRLTLGNGAELEVVPATRSTWWPSEPRYVPGRDYYPDSPQGRFILRTNTPGSESSYRFNLPSDTLHRPDYMDSAELNAIRYLRDMGHNEDEFPNYTLHDTIGRVERELS